MIEGAHPREGRRFAPGQGSLPARSIVVPLAILLVGVFLVPSLGAPWDGPPSVLATAPVARPPASRGAAGPTRSGQLDRANSTLLQGDGPASGGTVDCERVLGGGSAACVPAPPAAPSSAPLTNLTDHRLWENASTAPAPSQRAWSAMAYDAVDGYVLLFGGLHGRGFGATGLNDTWTYANGTWTQLHPPVSPGPRYSGAMAYDPSDGYVVLFGGWNASTFGVALSETWTFHGGTWSRATPSVSPRARVSPGLTYDGADGYLLLFGGSVNGRFFNDTWRYHAGQWSNLTTAHAPAVRDQMFMAYDAADGYVLLFGGEQGGPALGDTWEFSGGNWTEVFPSVAPGPHTTGTMAYDPETRSDLLFGGYDSGLYYNDTWNWSAGQWQAIRSPAGLVARSAAAMSYDGVDHEIVLFGGNPSGTTAQLNTTWAWTAPWPRIQATPPYADLGSNVTLTLRSSSPAGILSMLWSNVSPELGCSTTNLTVLSCYPMGPGSFHATVNVTDRDGAWSQGEFTFVVADDPMVTTPAASALSADLGQNVTFSTTATLGTPPYASYSWTGLEPGCTGTTSPSPRCTVERAGMHLISVAVTDATGTSSATSGVLDFPVYADPAIGPPTANRSGADVGQSATFSASAAFGSGGYAYLWTGLPPGCSSAQGTAVCQFGTAGNYTVTVSANDSNGIATPSSSPLNFTVSDPPTVQLSANRTVLDAGQHLRLVVTGRNGSGGDQNAWTGLPTSCLATGLVVDCTPGAIATSVTVTRTDSNGFADVSEPVNILVNPSIAASEHVSPDSPFLLGTTAHFTTSAYGGTAPLSYAWSFGDGTSGSGASTSHDFAQPGTYRVSVWVNDSVGGSSTDAIEITVNAPSQRSSSTPPTFLGLPGFEGYALLVGVVVAAVLAVVALLLRRRTRQRPSSPASRAPRRPPPRGVRPANRSRASGAPSPPSEGGPPHR